MSGLSRFLSDNNLKLVPVTPSPAGCGCGCGPMIFIFLLIVTGFWRVALLIVVVPLGIIYIMLGGDPSNLPDPEWFVPNF